MTSNIGLIFIWFLDVNTSFVGKLSCPLGNFVGINCLSSILLLIVSPLSFLVLVGIPFIAAIYSSNTMALNGMTL